MEQRLLQVPELSLVGWDLLMMSWGCVFGVGPTYAPDVGPTYAPDVDHAMLHGDYQTETS